MTQQVSNGVYFFHESFLLEISEKWITKSEVCEEAILLMKIVTSPYRTIMISCDRTLKKLSKSKHTIGFVPGIFDLIEEKSLSDEEDLKGDEYSLRVSSLQGIVPCYTYFVVSNDKKEKMKKYARDKGYKSIIVCCPADFELS